MTTKTLLRSFAGGEITPELFGRIDLVKNQTGLQKCLNFRILPHGPAENRPGFEYISEIKDSAKAVRIIPFIFSTEQTYIIELGEGYIRFHTNGATLLSPAQDITGVTQASPGVLTYDGDDPADGAWVYIAGVAGMTELNGRYFTVANVDTVNNTFELHDTAGDPVDTSGYGAYTADGTISPVYELATTYTADELFEIGFEQNADVLTLVHTNHPPRELSRLSAGSWQLTDITFAPSIATPAAPTVAAGSGSGSVSYSYKTTAVAADGLEESLASPADDVTNNLETAGNYNNITPATVTGAVRYNIYKLKTGGIYGYIGQTTGGAFKDDNIEPDVTRTPPEANNPFNAADDYPGAVTYFDQRRVFAGTNNKPLNVWMTRSATESNLSYSLPTQDDDSIVIKMAARQINRVRHVVPLNDLLALTAGSEIRIYAQNSDAITPNNVANRPQSYVGASMARPVVTNSSVLFTQALGSHIREMKYSFEDAKYNADDISLLAPHLFDDYTIVDMTYSRAPVPTVWAVRSDGLLLGLTYVPEQQVLAWHQHDTQGAFKSVACIPEGNEDVLYAVVEREINGRTVKYLERQHTRRFTTQADAFFVDSGLTYSGGATTTIGGLWHLEGETVSILGDGAVFPQQVVANGAITLEHAVSKAHIGLPYTSDLQTVPLAMEAAAGLQGTEKNISSVGLRVYRSSGIFAGPDADNLVEAKQRTIEPFGTPPALKTGIVDLNIYPDWNEDGCVFVRQTDPLPLTITALVLDVAIGG